MWTKLLAEIVLPSLNAFICKVSLRPVPHFQPSLAQASMLHWCWRYDQWSGKSVQLKYSHVRPAKQIKKLPVQSSISCFSAKQIQMALPLTTRGMGSVFALDHAHAHAYTHAHTKAKGVAGLFTAPKIDFFWISTCHPKILGYFPRHIPEQLIRPRHYS